MISQENPHDLEEVAVSVRKMIPITRKYDNLCNTVFVVDIRHI